MDEPASLDTGSLFSSIAELPVPMENHYAPLAEVFKEYSAELPDRQLPEPNSKGTCTCTRIIAMYTCIYIIIMCVYRLMFSTTYTSILFLRCAVYLLYFGLLLYLALLCFQYVACLNEIDWRHQDTPIEKWGK